MSEAEVDEITGARTTGHVWDDNLKELNQPLPRWWLWTFYVTIIWAIGYMIAYPAWPMISDYTHGVLGYSQRAEVARAVQQAKQGQAGRLALIAQKPLTDIRADADLLRYAITGGKAIFAENCAPCHGRGAQGSRGYPNLNDDAWIWGGTLDDIHKTVAVGIRSDHEDTRDNMMPRYGLDQLLEPQQINDVAEYVMAISGNKGSDTAAFERGKQVFVEQCVACHGEQGEGLKEQGAPSLIDDIWLFGGSKSDIVESISTGRGGRMPQWASRLDPTSIKLLTLYVHSLGGGK